MKTSVVTCNTNNIQRTTGPTDTPFSSSEPTQKIAKRERMPVSRAINSSTASTTLLPHTSEIDSNNLQMTSGFDMYVSETSQLTSILHA